MNCIIVDDNKLERVMLRHLISSIDSLVIKGECENIMQVIEILNKEKIDLLLLDIEMPEMTGIDFLKNINKRPLVILITAKPRYAVDAFEYNVVDFIVKPVKQDRLLKAIIRAKEILESVNNTLETTKDYFFIKGKGAHFKLLFSDILYMQALGDYVNVFTLNKKYTINYTLSAIEAELPAGKFMRVHRSYIAAVDKIDSIEEGTAYINQQPIPIANSQKAALNKLLNLL